MTQLVRDTLAAWAKASIRLLLKAYLYPMRRLLFSRAGAGSPVGKIRTSLKKAVAADARMLGALLDPGISEVRQALRAKDMELLRTLLGANSHELFKGYLEQLEAESLDAMRDFLSPGSQALHEIIFSENAVRLKSLLPPDSPELRELMLSQKAERLNLLLPPGAPELEELMLSQGAARLKALLPPGSKPLHTLVLGDDAVRLKSVLSVDNEPRKLFSALHAAFPPNTPVLYDLMGADGAERLKAVLAANKYTLARRILGVHSDILHAVLDAEDQKALRAYLFDNEFERLLPLLEMNNSKPLRHLISAERSPLRTLLTDPREEKMLCHLLFVQGLMHTIAALPLARAWCDFDRQWEDLETWADKQDGLLGDRIKAARGLIKGRAGVNEALLDVLYREGHLHVFNARLKFTDRSALYTLLQEILVNQDYFASIDVPSPRIIDCGAHQGISLYYFKTMFPDARITAFEPDPANRAIALENMRANGFQGVEILPYALAAREEKQVFHIQQGHSMAGSLTERRSHLAENAEEMESYEVQCVPLSPYLQEEVDYLKIDIEGVEDEVLQEAAPYLNRVRYLFCEYHHGLGLANDRLIRILDILEQSGFDTQVTKSYNFQKRTRCKPMDYVGEYYSSIIFAKRRQLNLECPIPGKMGCTMSAPY